MKLFGAILTLLGAACGLAAQGDPTPRPAAAPFRISVHQPDGKPADGAKIRFPATLAQVDPPRPAAAVSKLGGMEGYVIDGDVPFVVVSSPQGVGSTSSDAGPIKLKGVFAGGGGKDGARTVTGKQVTTVDPIGKGRVELIVIPVGFTKESEITRVTLDVDGKAGPDINPNPNPGPITDEAPIAGDGFKVLIVYDAANLNNLAAGQQAAINGAPTRAYLNAKCATGPDGVTKEFRIWASDVDATNESKVWQDAMKLRRDSLPWIVISNRKAGTGTGFQGRLPENLADITTLLKKYGGE